MDPLEEWKSKIQIVNNQYKETFLYSKRNGFSLDYRITCWQTRQPNGFMGPSLDPDCECIVCCHAGYSQINKRDLNDPTSPYFDVYIRCFTQRRDVYVKLSNNY